jgi:hypothetical protein
MFVSFPAATNPQEKAAEMSYMIHRYTLYASVWDRGTLLVRYGTTICHSHSLAVTTSCSAASHDDGIHPERYHLML